MTENALTVRDEMSLQDTMTLGETLAKSGFFSDARQAAQAVVKILAGRELGFGPIASMTGINVIQGKIAVGANLIAASVKRDPRYDYKVIRLDDDGCELAFYENGQKVGDSTFTMQNARETMYWNAKTKQMESLASKFNWKSWPRNMCFARAMSNGSKWYCPDAGGGSPVYTPDELGAQVDGEGELIEMPQQPAPPRPEQRDPGHAADIAEAQREIADTEGPHWIDRVDKNGNPIRKAFWAWASGSLSLTHAQVHEALDAESVRDYTGTMGEAKTAILRWVNEQFPANPEPTQEDEQSEPTD